MGGTPRDKSRGTCSTFSSEARRPSGGIAFTHGLKSVELCPFGVFRRIRDEQAVGFKFINKDSQAIGAEIYEGDGEENICGVDREEDHPAEGDAGGWDGDAGEDQVSE